MGIAIASGVPPITGLISGIIGGIIIGTISGSPLQVSGPAAGLAVMVFEAVNKYGVECLAPLGIVIGVFQFTIYVFKLADYFKAITPSLVKGLLGGIGVLILISQLYVAVDTKPIGGGLDNLSHLPSLFSNMIGGVGREAFFVALLTLFSIPLWSKFSGKLGKVLPGPLFAVLIATAATYIFNLQVKNINIPNDIISELNFISRESWDIFSPAFIATALAMGMVATAETLLSVKAVDQMSGRTSDYNKEIRAQGVGNFVAGIFGALPITGVIVRSSANVESGATSRFSAIFHGFWLILMVFFFQDILRVVPNATLAGILIFTGWRLLDVKSIPKLVKKSKYEAVVYFVTMGLIVSIDLLTGVVVGFLASVALIAKRSKNLKVEALEDDQNAEIIHLKLKGEASFLQIPKITKLLSETEKKNITVDCQELEYLDWAMEEQLKNWEEVQEQRGVKAKVLPKAA
jgi:MFS superfamily sulfate permease-like transporter